MAITKEVALDVKYTTSQDKDTGLITLTAQVTRNEFIPAQIFLYRRGTDGVSEFCTIASVADMSCIPPSVPGAGSPFFRLDHIELEFETAKALQTALAKIEAEVARLACDYQILVCELDAMFTKTYKGSDCA